MSPEECPIDIASIEVDLEVIGLGTVETPEMGLCFRQVSISPIYP